MHFETKKYFRRIVFVLATFTLVSWYIYLKTHELSEFVLKNEVPTRSPELLLVPTDNEPTTRPEQRVPSAFENSLKEGIKGCFVYFVNDANWVNARRAIREIEDRFNNRHYYPWVILSSVELMPEFEEYVGAMTTADITFAQIPHTAWLLPQGINLTRVYAPGSFTFRGGDSANVELSSRFLARYLAGPVFDHSLLAPYSHAWLVSSTSSYPCDITLDPFLYMHRHNISYSFVIPFRERPGEEESTHPSLWDTSLQFIDTHPQYGIPQNQSLVNFITQGSKHGGWNLCHFLPGAIEVLDLRFYRSPAYQEFFIAIDEAGGFFYAGWGPEHVRSIGSTLLLPRSAVKWWHEIGVREAGLAYCPSDLETGKARADCICRLEENFERSSKSCLAEFFDL